MSTSCSPSWLLLPLLLLGTATLMLTLPALVAATEGRSLLICVSPLTLLQTGNRLLWQLWLALLLLPLEVSYNLLHLPLLPPLLLLLLLLAQYKLNVPVLLSTAWWHWGRQL